MDPGCFTRGVRTVGDTEYLCVHWPPAVLLCARMCDFTLPNGSFFYPLFCKSTYMLIMLRMFDANIFPSLYVAFSFVCCVSNIQKLQFF